MWHKRMQDLARGMGKPHAPLFAPLLFGVAAQIEGILAGQMKQDGTRIRKNVGELRRALGIHAVFCCAPDDSQLAGVARIGADLSTEPMLAAALDAVRQWQADADPPVVMAALHGPGRIFHWQQTHGLTGNDDVDTAFGQIGDTLAAWVRAFAEAGVQAMQWYDTPPRDAKQIDAWQASLATAGNVARFHKVASILLLDASGQPAWPARAVACPTLAQHPEPMSGPYGRAWSAQPDEWPLLPGADAHERLITTAAEVPEDTSVVALMAAMQRIRTN